MDTERAKQQGSIRERTLTVSSVYREWGPMHRKTGGSVPNIRLSGRWLAALGLAVGQKVRVTSNRSTITIAPIALDRELSRYAK